MTDCDAEKPKAKRSARRLGPGLEMLKSDAIRARVRMKGHERASKVFPLLERSPEARSRQLAEAKAWHAETKRQCMAGSYVSSREAERLRLREVLEQYRDKGLSGAEKNAQKDRTRIEQILKDPIADRIVAGLHEADIASYRDLLIERAQQKHGKKPGRTTITNKLQLISRAMAFVGKSRPGFPTLTGVPVELDSESRDRRLLDGEMAKLIELGANTHPLLPYIIRFAIATALRRERILTFRMTYVRSIGGGRKVIMFPRNTQATNKRVGTIPVTREIQEILDGALDIWLKTHNKNGNVDMDDVEFMKINENTFDKYWRKLTSMANICDLHFHDLRHEATSRLFERGLTTAEVMSITGHSTNEMVDRYSHYSAANVFDRLEGTQNAHAILKEIRVLSDQYKALGGDIPTLLAAVSS